MKYTLTIRKAMPRWLRRSIGECLLFVVFVLAVLWEIMEGLYDAVTYGPRKAYEDWQGERVRFRYRKRFSGRTRTDELSR